MERYLKGSAATTSATFFEDGIAVDPGSVTVTIVREDGTAVVTAQATSGTGAAARTFNLTTTHLASLDVLTATWTSATKGTLTTTIEVVGGFLFTLAALRTTNPLTDTNLYPTADLITARTLAEDALEHACGVAFVPRYLHAKVDGSGGTDVLLPPRPLTVTSVVVGQSSANAGTTLTADQLADLELYDDGRLFNPVGWVQGRRNVDVRGSHGYAVAPALASRAALLLAKRYLVDTPLDERVSQITGDTSTSQILMADGTFSLPEADRCVSLYGVQQGIA